MLLVCRTRQKTRRSSSLLGRDQRLKPLLLRGSRGLPSATRATSGMPGKLLTFNLIRPAVPSARQANGT